MSTTATRKPFTSTRWATLASRRAYLSRKYAQDPETRLYWTDLGDLASELADRHEHLTFEQAQTLVDGTVSQIPVILTWEADLHDGNVETTKAAVVIEYLSTREAYIRYCGFSHWVQLSRIVGAEVFETVINHS